VCVCVCALSKAAHIFLALACSYQVFISYRINEASAAAEKLQDALAARHVTSFVSHLEPAGNSILDDVASALQSCKLFVILGTRTYGKRTEIGFSTYNELEYACDQNKPRYLIKMFDQGDFSETTTLLRLPRATPYVLWDPATDVPQDILDDICAMV
jgi:hypothetical protein